MFGMGNGKKEDRDHLIGDLLVEAGLSQCDIDRALDAQEEKVPLGDILIEMGIATSEQIAAARLEQRVRRGTASRKERVEHRRRLAGELKKLAKDSRETTIRHLQTAGSKG